MDNQRNYGIDFFRGVLMILIIFGHLYAHTEIRSQLSFLSSKWIFTWLSQAVTVCAVDSFVIITGYFSQKGSYNLWGGVKLWTKVWFYSVAISAVLFATKYNPMNIGAVLDAFFPVLRKEYWLFTMYILLLLLMPFINIGISNMSKKAHRALCIIILVFFYVEPILSAVFYQYDGTEGFSIVAFVTLYLIGSYLSRCGALKKKSCVIILILSSCTMLISKVILQFIIDRYSLSFGTGLLYHNNSVFVLINAVAMFELFLQKSVSNRIKKVVAWISPSIFSVYLIHEKPAIRRIIWNEQLVQILKESSFFGYVALVLGIGLGIFTVGILIDKILEWIIFTRVEKNALAQRIKNRCSEYNRIISDNAK